VIAAGCLAFERRIEMAERHHLVRPAGAAALGALNCLELISGTQWLCLAPAGGVGGAVYCRTHGGDCLEVWKGCGLLVPLRRHPAGSVGWPQAPPRRADGAIAGRRRLGSTTPVIREQHRRQDIGSALSISPTGLSSCGVMDRHKKPG